MHIKLAGKLWQFRYHPGARDGACAAPHHKGKDILVRAGLDDSYTLYLTLHEMLHAVLWLAREKWVEDASYSIRADLIRLGYRRGGGGGRRGVSALAKLIDGGLRVHVPWMDPGSRQEVSADLALALRRLGWHRGRKTQT